MGSGLDVDIVDGVQGSTSLSIVTQAVRRGLAGQRTAQRRSRWTKHVAGVLRLPTRRPVLAVSLAHCLGRAAYHEPALRRPRLRAVLTGWEIEQLTDNLLGELAAADVLLGISEFNSEVFRRHFPDTPVVTVSVCPPLPGSAAQDRERWGIPAGATVFLNMFDTVSGFDRKNPIDVHEAFTRAFPGRDDVRLVYKVHGGFEKNPDEADLTGEEERAARFLQICARDDRVILIDQFMSYDDVLSLVASSDAYVSLARAEGLGLPVLEAMALGVPTVCTAYSGHMDFAGSDSNLLVPYRLVDIDDTASHYYHPRAYSTPPQWAQPDVDVAAGHLRKLADDPELRQQLASDGRVAAGAHRRRSEEAAWVKELADALDSPHVARCHPMRNRAWQQVVDRDRLIWTRHERRVRRARCRLSARTRLGRVKRRLRRSVSRDHGL